MLGWEVRKPSIIGLMVSISIFMVFVAYTFLVYSLDNLVEAVLSLVLDILVFVIILLTASRDVQWLEIFSMPKFQKGIGIIAIVLAVISVIGMVAVSEGVISQIDASWILPFTVSVACMIILSDIANAQKEITH